MEPAARGNGGLRAARGEVAEQFEAELPSGTIPSAQHQARYWWAAQAVAGQRVLDAGCGAGAGAGILSRAGASEVVGVDIAPEAISTAMERYGSVASFMLGDLTALPFDSESFDVVVSFETIQHVADPGRALEELRRVLRPEGILLVSTVNSNGAAATNPSGLGELTSGELSHQLRRFFGHVRMLEQGDWFMSAVMEQCDARSTDVSRALPVELRKEVGAPADRELFAVGVASDATLRELPLGVSVACNAGGPQHEFREQVLLRHELERATTRERALRREHHALAERLWQVEQRTQVELTNAAADVDRARGAVKAMQASLSWRLTRPLRAIKGLLGRHP